MAKKIGLGLLVLVVALAGAVMLFQRPIGQAVFELLRRRWQSGKSKVEASDQHRLFRFFR